MTIEENREATASLTAAFFNEIADSHSASRFKAIAPYAQELSSLTQGHRCEVLRDIGYLAGYKRGEFGVVSLAFSLLGQQAHQAFLKTDNPEAYARLQRDSAVMYHMANLSLPHTGHGVVNPLAASELRRKTELLSKDATDADALKLCGTTKIALDSPFVGDRLLQPGTLGQPCVSRLTDGLIDVVAKKSPLYLPVCLNAHKALTALVEDKLRSPRYA